MIFYPIFLKNANFEKILQDSAFFGVFSQNRRISREIRRIYDIFAKSKTQNLARKSQNPH
ncbi:hypothetical protein ACWIUD_06185 [Helicobacter sp. 23-1044]